MKPWENRSGLPDPTPYQAEKEIKQQERAKQLENVIKYIAGLAGFGVSKITFIPIDHLDYQDLPEEMQLTELIWAVKYIIRHSSFGLIARIQLRNNHSGRTYK